MANGTPDDDYLSPKDMRSWVEQEIREVAKAAELRHKELNDLATAYEQGKLTPEQADERRDHYQHRWGEALRGTAGNPNLTDEEILARIDETRKPFETRREINEGYRKLFGRYPGEDAGPSR